MKHLGLYLLLLGLGLIACALVLREHSKGTGPSAPSPSQPMNRWQQSVTLDPNPEYASAAAKHQGAGQKPAVPAEGKR